MSSSSPTATVYSTPAVFNRPSSGRPYVAAPSETGAGTGNNIPASPSSGMMTPRRIGSAAPLPPPPVVITASSSRPQSSRVQQHATAVAGGTPRGDVPTKLTSVAPPSSNQVGHHSSHDHQSPRSFATTATPRRAAPPPPPLQFPMPHSSQSPGKRSTTTGATTTYESISHAVSAAIAAANHNGGSGGGGGVTIAEKAFGIPSPRQHGTGGKRGDGGVSDDPLGGGGRGLMPDIERVSSSLSAESIPTVDQENGGDGSVGSLQSGRQQRSPGTTTHQQQKQRPLSGKRLAKSDPGPARDIAQHNAKVLSAMFPPVPIRAHPPAVKTIADESITRVRERPITARVNTDMISIARDSHQHPHSSRERRASAADARHSEQQQHERQQQPHRHHSARSTVDDIRRRPAPLPFGRSSYARPGLLNPQERHDKQIQEHLTEYAKRLGIPTMEVQENNHFTKFESVFNGTLSNELATFESRLKVLQKQRAEEEAERQAEEQERMHAAMIRQQQLTAATGGNGGGPNLQRRSTTIMSKSPTPMMNIAKPTLSLGLTAAAGGGGNTNALLQRRQSAYAPQSATGKNGDDHHHQFASPGGGNAPLCRPSSSPSTSQSNEFPSMEVISSSMEATNREHHLTKLMFRRLLLNENALVEWITRDLGEQEVVRRLNAVNDRYGVRRITQDDFYFLMQELMQEPPGMNTTTTPAFEMNVGGGVFSTPGALFGNANNNTNNQGPASGAGAAATSTARYQSRANSMMFLESWSGSDAGGAGGHNGIDLSEPRGNRGDMLGTVDGSGGEQQQAAIDAPSSAPLRDDLLPPQTSSSSSQLQPCSWKKRPYTLQRSDADLLFTACDWRLIGVVEDNEVTDAIRLLFRPAEQVIASHCKRVLEGRCSVSQMLSMHEAGTMLHAVADIARHRYGSQIDGDVHMVMDMLEEVMTSGYVPLVCFRNFTVHGITLSRALNEMSMNAELPHAQLHIPSPDPDRDMAAVAQQVAQQNYNTNQNNNNNSVAASSGTMMTQGKSFYGKGNAGTTAAAQQQQQANTSAPSSPLKTPRQPNGNSTMFRAFDEQHNNKNTAKTSNATGNSATALAPSSSSAFQEQSSDAAFGGAAGGSASSSSASPRNTEGRDLTHSRFRADQSLVQGRVAVHIPEHDAPSWYSNGGIVWMKNSMHGPLAMT